MNIMAKKPIRKPLSESIKKDVESRSKKHELADDVIEKLSPGEKIKKTAEKEKIIKLTVDIPAELKDKIKLKALERKSTIRELIIGFIESL